MRKWLRFSLRTALVAMTLVGVALGLHLARWRAAEFQRGVVAKINAGEGRVIYDYEAQTESDARWPIGSEWSWEMRSPSPFSSIATAPPASTWWLNRLGVDYFASVKSVGIRDLYVWRGALATREQIAERQRVNAEILGELAQLPTVELLSLPDMSPESLHPLRQMRGLKRLILRGELTPQHLPHITASSAEQIDLIACADDQVMAALCQMPHLRRLRMPLKAESYRFTVTDEGMKSVGSMTELTSLALFADEVTQVSARELARLQNLNELELRLPRMTADLPTALAGKKLQTLILGWMAVGDAEFAAIGQLKELQTLGIESPRRVDEPYPPRGELDELLGIGDAPPRELFKLSAASLAAICQLKKLQRLRLDRFDLSPAEIRTLLQHLPLKCLEVSSDISHADGDAIIAEFPNVEIRCQSARKLVEYSRGFHPYKKLGGP